MFIEKVAVRLLDGQIHSLEVATVLIFARFRFVSNNAEVNVVGVRGFGAGLVE